ncbi:MAG: hypothetical protein KC776_05405 [Myxococcales bacterium]|nr:hypothetical protein [Myxococcales bacterium]MCB9583353.1 hypothetical protein [Polyangiaceae bacterium]
MRVAVLFTLFLAGCGASPKPDASSTAPASAAPAPDPEVEVEQQLTEAEAVHKSDPERAAHMASDPCTRTQSSKNKARCFNLGVMVQ